MRQWMVSSTVFCMVATRHLIFFSMIFPWFQIQFQWKKQQNSNIFTASLHLSFPPILLQIHNYINLKMINYHFISLTHTVWNMPVLHCFCQLGIIFTVTVYHRHPKKNPWLFHDLGPSTIFSWEISRFHDFSMILKN